MSNRVEIQAELMTQDTYSYKRGEVCTTITAKGEIVSFYLSQADIARLINHLTETLEMARLADTRTLTLGGEE